MKRPELLPTTFFGSLFKLTEECGEVLQVIGKIQRHGIVAIDPSTPTIIYDNGKDLMDELNDLSLAINSVKEYYLTVDKTPQSGQPIW